MTSLYTIGNLAIDDIVMPDGRAWMAQAGGGALYAALGALVWRSDVGLIARLGNDLPAEFACELDDLGLDLLLVPVDTPNIRHWALYEAGGRRQFVLHGSSGGHDELAVRAAELPASTRGAAAYHLAPMPSVRQLELARALRTPATVLALDPHADYLAGHQATLEELLSLIDICLPSRDEARRLLGRDDPAAAARMCAALGPGIVAVKLGADGCLVYEASSDRLTYVPCYEVQTVDPTGAGDAFCGGFLAGYLAHGDAVYAACYGTVSASFAVEHVGALPRGATGSAAAGGRLAALRAEVAGLHSTASNPAGASPTAGASPATT